MSYSRKQPVYFLVDTSAPSWEGSAVAGQVVSNLIRDLRRNPQAIETAYVSVIAFDGDARQLTPLTELWQFNKMPELRHTSPGRALGAALRLLLSCMSRELVKNTLERAGDWNPICLLLMGGDPTDSWEEAADELRRRAALGRGYRSGRAVLAVSPEADLATLRRFWKRVVEFDETNPARVVGAFTDEYESFWRGWDEIPSIDLPGN